MLAVTAVRRLAACYRMMHLGAGRGGGGGGGGASGMGEGIEA